MKNNYQSALVDQIFWTNLRIQYGRMFRAESQTSLLRNISSGGGRGETAVFTDWKRTCTILFYDRLYSLSVFLLAKSLQLILEIGATYRLVSYLLPDNWLICRLRAQCMISINSISIQVPCEGVFVAIFFKTMPGRP